MKAASQVAVTEAEDPLLGFLKKKEPERKDQKKGIPVTDGGLAPFRAGENGAVRPPVAVPVPSASAARPLASPRVSTSGRNSVSKAPDEAGNITTIHMGKSPSTAAFAASNAVARGSTDGLLAPDQEESKGRTEPTSHFFCPTCGAKQSGSFCGVCGTKFPVLDHEPKIPSNYVQVEDYVEDLKATAGLVERIQSSVSPEVSDLYIDDWSNVSAQMTGEKPTLLNINDVAYCRPRRTIMGVLIMTPYQLFFEPVKITKYSKRVYGSNTSGVIAVPLASIERLDIAQVPSKSRREAGTILDAYCKDTRLLRFAFKDADQCKRASQVIAGYVFPGPENPKYLFCFAYQSALMKAFQTQGLWKDGPLSGKASPVDGWQLYNPIREYKRMGLPTADLVISLVNENYTVCPTYPGVLALPASFTEADIRQIANFRSRGRLPVLSWKHPFGDQSIWRCSQPKTGVAGVRCVQDEELLKKIKAMNPGMKDKPLTIFDCRPRLNAWANKTAGKGFEDTQYYTSCKLRFMNIENIHTMRIAYQKLAKACQKQVDDQEFPKSVIESGWLFHLSEVIKATVEMVITVDRDGCSIMSHCSDGWDRTGQLVALAMLCLDPYYRTTVGFLRLIDKEWLGFGHKFGERTGHGDKNYNDEQRAPIFLQWLDCVYQITCQFPRHFQFNSAFLVCLASHLYSCRFGTFLFDTECERDKFELKTKTASLWSYLLVSPAALDGQFTNPFYSFGGDGDMTLENCSQYRQTSTPRDRSISRPAEVTETVEGEILGDIVGEMGDDEVEDELHTGPRLSKVASCSPQNNRGAVLCPSWSLKRLTVWSDYYLRWNTEETQTIGHGTGLMPPFGSATTTLISSESLYHQQMKNYQRTVSELAEAKEKIRHLELLLSRKDAPTEEKKDLPPSVSAETAEDTPSLETSDVVQAPQQPVNSEADVEKNLDSLIAELDKELGETNQTSEEQLSAALDPSATMSFDALVSPMASEDSLFASPSGSSDFSLATAHEPNPFDSSSPGFQLSSHYPISSESHLSTSSSSSSAECAISSSATTVSSSELPSQDILTKEESVAVPATSLSSASESELNELQLDKPFVDTSSEHISSLSSLMEIPNTEAASETPSTSISASNMPDVSTTSTPHEVIEAEPPSVQHTSETPAALASSHADLSQINSAEGSSTQSSHAMPGLDYDSITRSVIQSIPEPIHSPTVYDATVDQLNPPLEGEVVEEI